MLKITSNQTASKVSNPFMLVGEVKYRRVSLPVKSVEAARTIARAMGAVIID